MSIIAVAVYVVCFLGGLGLGMLFRCADSYDQGLDAGMAIEREAKGKAGVCA